METLWKDVRYGLRTLLKNPGFAGVAVLTLALGIGANTAIFSVVNALLLRPLPFRDLDRLVAVWETAPAQGLERNEASEPNFLDWRAEQKSFEHLALYSWWSVNVSNVETPERVQGYLVSPNFFQALAVKPALGRDFLPEEEQPGKDRVVMLGYGYWQSRFAADPHIIGRTLTLNGIQRTVVGVMPRDFNYPAGGEMWAPYRVDPADPSPRFAHFLLSIGRLKAGVTREQAQAEMNAIAARLEAQYPETNTGRRVVLNPLLRDTVSFYSSALLILMGAVGFVLLIACANVANLLLARATARQREMAIRSALGAGRWRIIRQLVTESTLLALVGGSLGVLLAFWGVDLLVTLFPRDAVRFIAGWEHIGIDLGALGFTLLLSLLTGVVFGLAPALAASRPDLNESLKEGGSKGASGGAGRNRLRALLVVSEVALSLVLLIGAGLMLKSFVRLLGTDPGFNPDGVLAAELTLPRAKYKNDAQAIEFYRQLLERVGNLPGVRSASVVNFIPLAGGNATTSFSVEGRPEPAHGEELGANYRVVSPGYFQTLEIPVRRGRVFGAEDTPDSSHVVMINEALVRRDFPQEDPLGKRIRGEAGADGAKPWLTIIGVVADTRHSLNKPPTPELYFPYTQDASRTMVLVARTAGGDPLGLVPSLRNEIATLDRDLPVYNVRTLAQVRSESIFLERLSIVLLGVFATVALMLAAVGIYGVMAYSVTQRTHEIGIRMALGAQPDDVLKLVVGQGMILALVGVLVGAAVAFGVTRMMQSLLYGVSATDAPTFALVSLLLSAVALLACYLPARRAMKVDPIIALRYE